MFLTNHLVHHLGVLVAVVVIGMHLEAIKAVMVKLGLVLLVKEMMGE